jgi:hypothetical protein
MVETEGGDGVRVRDIRMLPKVLLSDGVCRWRDCNASLNISQTCFEARLLL